jgi:predicted AAA+ superfamily ATPase
MSQDKEVDFVAKLGKKYQYFEVKYHRNITLKDISLPEVITNKPATIITHNSFAKKGKIKLVPLSIFTAFPEEYVEVRRDTPLL